MQKLYQRGSTQTIIVIVLVFTLIMALGVIFWQNFINRPTGQQSDQKTAQETKKPAIKSVEYCAQIEKLCVNVPDSWTVDLQLIKRNEGDPQEYNADSDIFVSPDTAVTIKLATGFGGLGGACLAEDTAGAYFHTIKSVELTIPTSEYNADYSVPNLHVVTGINETADGTFTPSLQVTSNKVAATIGKHQVCDVFLSSFFIGKNVPTGYADSHGAISFQTLDDKSYDSYKQADDALKAESYQSAHSILASAHYK